MSLPRTVAEVIDQHVTLELECMDRMYLNVYQPKLQTPKAVFWFLREFPGKGAVSSHKMRDITQRFIKNIWDYAEKHEVPVIRFEKGQRKEDVAAEYIQKSDGRTQRKRNASAKQNASANASAPQAQTLNVFEGRKRRHSTFLGVFWPEVMGQRSKGCFSL